MSCASRRRVVPSLLGAGLCQRSVSCSAVTCSIAGFPPGFLSHRLFQGAEGHRVDGGLYLRSFRPAFERRARRFRQGAGRADRLPPASATLCGGGGRAVTAQQHRDQRRFHPWRGGQHIASPAPVMTASKCSLPARSTASAHCYVCTTRLPNGSRGGRGVGHRRTQEISSDRPAGGACRPSPAVLAARPASAGYASEKELSAFAGLAGKADACRPLVRPPRLATAKPGPRPVASGHRMNRRAKRHEQKSAASGATHGRYRRGKNERPGPSRYVPDGVHSPRSVISAHCR